MKIHPRGTRIRVKILSSEERKTKGGVIIPARAVAAEPGGDPSEMAKAMGPTLVLVVLLEVGEGKYNQETGTYNGSRYADKIGKTFLMRFSPSALIHIDFIPWNHNEALVQEDVLAAELEYEENEPEGEVPA